MSQRVRVTPSTTNESAIFPNHTQETPEFTTTPAPSDLPLDNVSEIGSRSLATPELLHRRIEPTNTHNMSFPKSVRLTGLFSKYLHGAILKIGDTADMTLSLSLSLGVCDGYLCLAIVPNRAHFLAMKLLGANMESNDQQRYIVDEHGRKSIPEPSIKLTGVSIDALPDFFGPLLLFGIAESTQRKDEVRDGQPFTECLYMRISCNPRDCVYLYITMGSSTVISVYMHCFGPF
jgi:hypothetical protein